LTSLKKLKRVGTTEVKSVSLLPLNSACDELKQTEISSINYPPSIKNQIDRIEGVKGRYLVYKIKSDFCYDPEDGETSRLKLSLRNVKDFQEFPENFWMQFDDKNQEIYGLPMETQTFSAVLVCSDLGGNSFIQCDKIKKQISMATENIFSNLSATKYFRLRINKFKIKKNFVSVEIK
jgi:hypothetical protein